MMLMKPANVDWLRRCADEFWPAALVSLVSWVSVVCCLDPVGSYPNWPEGPGLTIDEVFNVSQGVLLVERARALGWYNLVPGTSQDAFLPENGYNPDHPPLGRWWLGVHHHLWWWLFPPLDPEHDSFVIACARTGSASAFALTVLLVGCFATAWNGRFVGVMSAVSLVLMPRLYGHAHLASLESMTNLTCTLAVLSVAHLWNGAEKPCRTRAAFCGCLLGLAFVTKIQAILIPIPVICWALWIWRTKAIVPLAVWGLAALAVFFACWPYLWVDSFRHLMEYLGRTTNRATLQVWYLGQKYPDKLVPWHFSFVMFGLTVPMLWHLLGIAGVAAGLSRKVRSAAATSPGERCVPTAASSERCSTTKRTQRDSLVFLCLVFPLAVFALPGVAVYDGERLFLTSFPLWAMFIGRGWGLLATAVSRVISARGNGPDTALSSNIIPSNGFPTWPVWMVLAPLLLYGAAPIYLTAPCHLCYYNEIASVALGGVDRAGLEVDYWGEGITRRLLRRLIEVVPEGSTVAVVPTLHQFQADQYRSQSPLLRSHRIRTAEFQEPDGRVHPDGPVQYVLIYRRLADLSDKWHQIPDEDVLATVRIQGRVLAYLVRNDSTKSQATVIRD